MAKKDKYDLIIELLLKIDDELADIDEKIKKSSAPDDIYVEIEPNSPILIPEELYLLICDELGEDCLRFMGIS